MADPDVEVEFCGLSHSCTDPDCHVAGFVATLNRKTHSPCDMPDCATCNAAFGRILDDLHAEPGERTIRVTTFDLTDEAHEALFNRVADAAHALDEQVICSGSLNTDDTDLIAAARREGAAEGFDRGVVAAHRSVEGGRVGEVLAAHADWFNNRKPATECRWLCTCGAEIDENYSGVGIVDRHRAHVAAALVRAGIGDVREAKAEALREAADEMDRSQRIAKTAWRDVSKEDEQWWRTSPLSDDALFDARPTLSGWLRARADEIGKP